jgi:hypothetical protein
LSHKIRNGRGYSVNATQCKRAAKSKAPFQIATKLWQNKNKKINCHKTVAKLISKLKLPQKHHSYEMSFELRSLFGIPQQDMAQLPGMETENMRRIS